MSKVDYMCFGSAPSDETPVQVGDENYAEKALAECRRFIRQLLKEFGPEPLGARLLVKPFSHDFGTYYEVVCRFDYENEVACDYAFEIENSLPRNWKEE